MLLIIFSNRLRTEEEEEEEEREWGPSESRRKVSGRSFSGVSFSIATAERTAARWRWGCRLRARVRVRVLDLGELEGFRVLRGGERREEGDEIADCILGKRFERGMGKVGFI